MKKWEIKQRDNRDCGVCCLLSIIKYYGGNISLEQLRLDSFTSDNGTSAYHLIKTLKKYNFESLGLKINNDSINKICLPAIAHVIINNYHHFVVIYEVNNNYLKIMDPSKGLIKIKKEEWIKIFSNNVIICHPLSKIINYQSPKSILILLKKVFTSNKKMISKIIVTSLILTICNIFSSFFLKFALNTIDSTGTYFYLQSVIIGFSLILIVKLMANYTRSYFEEYLNKNIDISLIIPFLKHIFRVPLSIIKSRSVGEISTRVYELNEIKELFTKIIITVFLDLILALSAFVILFSINKLLTIIVVVMLFVYAIFGIIYSPIIKKKAFKNIEEEIEYNSSLIETIMMSGTIKNIHKLVYYENKLINKLLTYLSNTFYFRKTIINQQIVKEIINEIGMYIIMIYGVILISKGNLSIVNLITFFSIINYLIEPFKNIIDYLPKIEYIKATYNKIEDYINIEEENLIIKKEKFINGDIFIKNLSYSYDGYNKILNNINICIKEKEKVMITGPSGCGKSTICKSILRLINYQDGVIKINDINIKDYTLNTLRSNISYIDQNELLMSDTIINNITLNNHYSIKEFNELMSICKIDEIVLNKPLRYNTYLFEQGTNLSGGEKQRIILARGLLQNKKIIILDEALSQVSLKMEKEIISKIIKKYTNKTIIYVTHRQHKDIFKHAIEVGN